MAEGGVVISQNIIDNNIINDQQQQQQQRQFNNSNNYNNSRRHRNNNNRNNMNYNNNNNNNRNNYYSKRPYPSSSSSNNNYRMNTASNSGGQYYNDNLNDYYYYANNTNENNNAINSYNNNNYRHNNNNNNHHHHHNNNNNNKSQQRNRQQSFNFELNNNEYQNNFDNNMMNTQNQNRSQAAAAAASAKSSRSYRTQRSLNDLSKSTPENEHKNQQEQQQSQQQQAKQEQSKKSQPKPQKDKKQQQPKEQKIKRDETRSEILIEQLVRNKYECMVCCSLIKQDAAVWSCNVCYHIFHLFCIKKWAKSPSANVEENSQKWRCPGCQNIHDTVPNRYTCFCGKRVDPEYHKQQTPHSCGETCGKAKSLTGTNPNCVHKCTALCHPGPCQQCDAMITRQCGCGKLNLQVKCSSNKIPQCDNICNKPLNCNIHKCTLNCHGYDCPPCDVYLEQKCYSHNTVRSIRCDNSPNSQNKFYKCNNLCGKVLKCGEHTCKLQCHDGDCEPCLLLPDNLKLCPCGKTSINELLNETNMRKKCTDPIPTCDKPCDKVLSCSKYDNNEELHLCEYKCHNGECSVCEKQVELKCRCGGETKKMSCKEARQYTNANPLLCNRRCSKKKTCGRHKCTETCCDIGEHICLLVCNRTLTCGNHKCEQLCHKGGCPRCLVASFDELICNCGRTVVYPPIKCGTILPDCPHLCQRRQECEHEVTHKCHPEEQCPPCTYLTSKTCMGGHELRHNIPCYLKEVSCGLPCNKPLKCGKHKCLKTCHKGLCEEENEVCTQPCQSERPHCIHACLSPCHVGKPCPDTVCQELVVKKCKCGLKTSQPMKCGQRMYDSSTVVFENLASEIKEMLSCRTIDVNAFRDAANAKKKYELECDDECMLVERNRQFAQALDVDPNAIRKPLYSDFLKQFAREDMEFVVSIEKEFAKLIKETITSKQAKKMFNFPTMKSNDRKFIHELAGYYNLETLSQEKEPNRSVRITAIKDKSTIPSVLLSNSVEVRRPTVMPHMSNLKMSNLKTTTKPETLKTDAEIPLTSRFALIENLNDDNLVKETSKSNQNKIDYFDFTE